MNNEKVDNPWKKPNRVFYYVKRSDGSVVDIPEKDLEQTLKLHPDWRVMSKTDDQTFKEDLKVKVDDAPKSSPLECPICGFVAKSESGLRNHKKSKH